MGIEITTLENGILKTVPGEDIKAEQPKVESKEDKPTQDVETTDQPAKSEEVETQETDDLDYLNDVEETQDTDSEDDNDSEDDESNDEEDTSKKTKKSGFEKRIDREIRKRHELEEKIAELEKRLTKNEPKDENSKSSKAEEDLKEPKFDDFDEYSEYLKALVKYERQKEKAEEQLSLRQKQEEKDREAVELESAKIIKKYQETEKEAKKQYKDWNKFKESGLPIHQYAQSHILSSDIGPHIAYYLYKHQDTLEKLNNSTFTEQAKIISRIELKLEGVLKPTQESKKKDLSTPVNPIKPSSAAGRHSNAFREDMTLSEYREWRKKNG